MLRRGNILRWRMALEDIEQSLSRTIEKKLSRAIEQNFSVAKCRRRQSPGSQRENALSRKGNPMSGFCWRGRRRIQNSNTRYFPITLSLPSLSKACSSLLVLDPISVPCPAKYFDRYILDGYDPQPKTRCVRIPGKCGTFTFKFSCGGTASVRLPLLQQRYRMSTSTRQSRSSFGFDRHDGSRGT